MTQESCSIEEHWDRDGLITEDSDPQEEYEMWADHACLPSTDWTGEEFSLEDFERYIAGLQSGDGPRLGLVQAATRINADDPTLSYAELQRLLGGNPKRS